MGKILKDNPVVVCSISFVYHKLTVSKIILFSQDFIESWRNHSKKDEFEEGISRSISIEEPCQTKVIVSLVSFSLGILITHISQSRVAFTSTLLETMPSPVSKSITIRFPLNTDLIL